MSTFVLEREGRLKRHRTESRALKGLASRILVCVAVGMHGGNLDGPAADARGRAHDQRAWSPRTDPARSDAGPARTAHRDCRRARRIGSTLLGGSCRTSPASRHDLDAPRFRHGGSLRRLASAALLALRRLRPLLGHGARARGIHAAGRRRSPSPSPCPSPPSSCSSHAGAPQRRGGRTVSRAA